MLRFLWLCGGLLLTTFGVQAASIDCATTHHPIEQIVCNNEALLQLEREAIERIGEIEKFVIAGDTSLSTDQRLWWQEIGAQCTDTAIMAECLQENYAYRMGLLRNHPTSTLRGAEGLPYFFMTGLSPFYDIGLRPHKPTNCIVNEPCYTKAALAIHRKRHKNAHQIIELPYEWFAISPLAAGESCALRDMETMSFGRSGCTIKFNDQILTQDSFGQLFQIADYNFDGLPDFAFRIKNSHGYVFIYNAQDEMFYYAPALSDLFAAYFVDVDKKQQQIQTFHRAGYRFEERYYHVEHNQPVRVRSVTHDREGDDLVTSEFVWQNGIAQLDHKESIPYWRGRQYAGLLDCGHLEQPRDHVVCDYDDDEELFQLYERLMDLFHETQQFIIKGDTTLIEAQRRWWQILQLDLTENSNSQIRGEIGVRIEQLNSYPYAQSIDANAVVLWRNSDLLDLYDIGLTANKPADCAPDTSCKITSDLVFYKKGEDEVYQAIGLPWRDAITSASSENNCFDTNKPYDTPDCTIWFWGHVVTAGALQNLFHVEDYNFDGFPDVAMRMFMPSNPSRRFEQVWLFLYDSQERQFYYAPALNDLFYYRQVQIHAEKQQLKSFFSDPGLYEEIDYRVEHNQPVPLRKLLRSSLEGENVILEQEHVWQEGDWHEVRTEKTAINK